MHRNVPQEWEIYNLTFGICERKCKTNQVMLHQLIVIEEIIKYDAFVKHWCHHTDDPCVQNGLFYE